MENNTIILIVRNGLHFQSYDYYKIVFLEYKTLIIGERNKKELKNAISAMDSNFKK